MKTLASTLIAAFAMLIIPLTSCDEQTAAGIESVKIDGTWFYLELADTPEIRLKGLGDRDYIAPDGGMLFVFPHPQQLAFVMRDCLVAIDIVFLDAGSRVIAMHHMPAEELEPPQGKEESDTDYRRRRSRYELRLKKYPSRYAAQFALEFAGGTLEGLEIEPGQKIDLDAARLKNAAR